MSKRRKKKHGNGAFGKSSGQKRGVPKISAFPASADDFNDVSETLLSVGQAEYLDALKSQFPDVKPVTREGSGILHAFSPDAGVAFQSPPQIAALPA